MLLRANHEDKKVLMDGSLVECKRGQLITSLYALAKDWGVSRDVIRHYLDLLESDAMIQRKATSKYTQITICNYASYQDISTTEPLQTHYKPTTEPLQSHLNNNNNNDNNVNKEENNIYGGVKNSRFKPPTVDEVKAYCQERGNNIDAQYFVDYYAKIGWVCGRSKTKMKDWKASVRTWERNNKTAAPKTLGYDEWMDGERRTYGTGEITIPLDAPARPSARHAWSKAQGKWILM